MTTLIKNGIVIDPAQGIHDKLNVIIKDAKIATVTNENITADKVINADNNIVCPGFVDIHMHEDDLENNSDISSLACLLRMGVTTGLAGNCGENKYNPIDYLNKVETNGTFINIAMLAGHGYYREKYSKADRYSGVSAKELDDICSHLKYALDNGCFGISFGLEYIPGTTKEELIRCASLAKGKMISAHIRSCGINAKTAIEEIAQISKKTGISAQISHIGSMAGYGQMKEALTLIDKYRKDGVNISCDCYPYLAYCTSIGSAVYDDGWKELMFCDYSDIEMCEGEYKGKRCTKEIFDFERKNHPSYYTVGHVIKSDDITMAYKQPYTMVGSDAIFNNGNGHPRAAGTYPKFFKDFVSTNIINIDEAINKCTNLPAQKLGLKNKGNLISGADADILIFNLNEYKDNATYLNPISPPDGVRYVIINGKIAVKNKHIINSNCGDAIFS